ncbi:unnamed protein product [Calicophoron daubneyi]|uniref:Uncharacterized protein n=1 Tax=Calicophoron daubneyi TaxID=300641 RepID=A0AAV2TDG0_CALDB
MSQIVIPGTKNILKPAASNDCNICNNTGKDQNQGNEFCNRRVSKLSEFLSKLAPVTLLYHSNRKSDELKTETCTEQIFPRDPRTDESLYRKCPRKTHSASSKVEFTGGAKSGDEAQSDSKDFYRAKVVTIPKSNLSAGFGWRKAKLVRVTSNSEKSKPKATSHIENHKKCEAHIPTVSLRTKKRRTVELEFYQPSIGSQEIRAVSEKNDEIYPAVCSSMTIAENISEAVPRENNDTECARCYNIIPSAIQSSEIACIAERTNLNQAESNLPALGVMCSTDCCRSLPSQDDGRANQNVESALELHSLPNPPQHSPANRYNHMPKKSYHICQGSPNSSLSPGNYPNSKAKMHARMRSHENEGTFAMDLIRQKHLPQTCFVKQFGLDRMNREVVQVDLRTLGNFVTNPVTSLGCTSHFSELPLMRARTHIDRYFCPSNIYYDNCLTPEELCRPLIFPRIVETYPKLTNTPTLFSIRHPIHGKRISNGETRSKRKGHGKCYHNETRSERKYAVRNVLSATEIRTYAKEDTIKHNRYSFRSDNVACAAKNYRGQRTYTGYHETIDADSSYNDNFLWNYYKEDFEHLPQNVSNTGPVEDRGMENRNTQTYPRQNESLSLRNQQPDVAERQASEPAQKDYESHPKNNFTLFESEQMLDSLNVNIVVHFGPCFSKQMSTSLVDPHESMHVSLPPSDRLSETVHYQSSHPIQTSQQITPYSRSSHNVPDSSSGNLMGRSELSLTSGNQMDSNLNPGAPTYHITMDSGGVRTIQISCRTSIRLTFVRSERKGISGAPSNQPARIEVLRPEAPFSEMESIPYEETSTAARGVSQPDASLLSTQSHPVAGSEDQTLISNKKAADVLIPAVNSGKLQSEYTSPAEHEDSISNRVAEVIGTEKIGAIAALAVTNNLSGPPEKLAVRRNSADESQGTSKDSEDSKIASEGHLHPAPESTMPSTEWEQAEENFVTAENPTVETSVSTLECAPQNDSTDAHAAELKNLEERKLSPLKSVKSGTEELKIEEARSESHLATKSDKQPLDTETPVKPDENQPGVLSVIISQRSSLAFSSYLLDQNTPSVSERLISPEGPPSMPAVSDPLGVVITEEVTEEEPCCLVKDSDRVNEPPTPSKTEEDANLKHLFSRESSAASHDKGIITKHSLEDDAEKQSVRDIKTLVNINIKSHTASISVLITQDIKDGVNDHRSLPGIENQAPKSSPPVQGNQAIIKEEQTAPSSTNLTSVWVAMNRAVEQHGPRGPIKNVDNKIEIVTFERNSLPKPQIIIRRSEDGKPFGARDGEIHPGDNNGIEFHEEQKPLETGVNSTTRPHSRSMPSQPGNTHIPVTANKEPIFTQVPNQIINDLTVSTRASKSSINSNKQYLSPQRTAEVKPIEITDETKLYRTTATEGPRPLTPTTVNISTVLAPDSLRQSTSTSSLKTTSQKTRTSIHAPNEETIAQKSLTIKRVSSAVSGDHSHSKRLSDEVISATPDNRQIVSIESEELTTPIRSEAVSDHDQSVHTSKGTDQTELQRLSMQHLAKRESEALETRTTETKNLGSPSQLSATSSQHPPTVIPSTTNRAFAPNKSPTSTHASLPKPDGQISRTVTHTPTEEVAAHEDPKLFIIKRTPDATTTEIPHAEKLANDFISATPDNRQTVSIESEEVTTPVRSEAVGDHDQSMHTSKSTDHTELQRLGMQHLAQRESEVLETKATETKNLGSPSRLSATSSQHPPTVIPSTTNRAFAPNKSPTPIHASLPKPDGQINRTVAHTPTEEVAAHEGPKPLITERTPGAATTGMPRTKKMANDFTSATSDKRQVLSVRNGELTTPVVGDHDQSMHTSKVTDQTELQHLSTQHLSRRKSHVSEMQPTESKKIEKLSRVSVIASQPPSTLVTTSTTALLLPDSSQELTSKRPLKTITHTPTEEVTIQETQKPLTMRRLSSALSGDHSHSKQSSDIISPPSENRQLVSVGSEELTTQFPSDVVNDRGQSTRTLKANDPSELQLFSRQHTPPRQNERSEEWRAKKAKIGKLNQPTTIEGTSPITLVTTSTTVPLSPTVSKHSAHDTLHKRDNQKIQKPGQTDAEPAGQSTSDGREGLFSMSDDPGQPSTVGTDSKLLLPDSKSFIGPVSASSSSKSTNGMPVVHVSTSPSPNEIAVVVPADSNLLVPEETPVPNDEPPTSDLAGTEFSLETGQTGIRPLRKTSNEPILDPESPKERNSFTESQGEDVSDPQSRTLSTMVTPTRGKKHKKPAILVLTSLTESSQSTDYLPFMIAHPCNKFMMKYPRCTHGGRIPCPRCASEISSLDGVHYHAKRPSCCHCNSRPSVIKNNCKHQCTQIPRVPVANRIDQHFLNLYRTHLIRSPCSNAYHQCTEMQKRRGPMFINMGHDLTGAIQRRLTSLCNPTRKNGPLTFYPVPSSSSVTPPKNANDDHRSFQLHS